MKKIYIGVTSYTGMIDVGNCDALLNNIRDLEKKGYDVTLQFECGNCYIAQARNMVVAKFLETLCDYLIFVDSDLWFSKNAMYKLIEHNKDIVCGCYPYRTGDFGYPIKVNVNSDQTPIVDSKTGLISISGGATGLMCIRRNVLVTMIEENPAWKTYHVTPTFGTNLYALFDTGIHREPHKWYGEDYLFCARAIDHNFELWCYPDIDFHHIGKNNVVGNYHKFLLNQPKPEVNNEPTK